MAERHTESTIQGSSDRTTTPPFASVPDGLRPYFQVSTVERDWILSMAIRYFIELENHREVGQHIALTERQQTGLAQVFSRYKLKKRLDHCLLKLRPTENPEVNVDHARASGLGGNDDLLCLAALQFVQALRLRVRRHARSDAPSDSVLWSVFRELMEFCHTNLFRFEVVYEERPRRERINRKTPREPKESYTEWRRRAAPLILEMHPISVRFVRFGTEVECREDRSAFHRQWLDKVLAEAWHYGSQP